MVLYRKLWNYDLRRKKNMTNFKNYENFIYNGKNYVIDQNNFSF